MAQSLNENEVDEALKSLNGWKFEDDQLKKEYTFENFKEALGFLVQVGFHAEAQGHHPNIHNVYNTVNIALTTHDAGDQVTEKDVELARAIDTI